MVSSVRVQQEQRVNTLESRLQELSETVGTYDRLRQHDQSEIRKLKDKIAHLDHELTIAKSAAESSSKKTCDSQLDDDEEIKDKFLALKKVLMDRGDQDDILYDGELKKKYDSLKEEFETYKKNNSGSPAPALGRYLLPEVDQEAVLSLKTQISELQDKIALLRQQLLESEDNNSAQLQREQELTALLKEAKLEAKEKLESLDNDYKAKLLNLESELQKQRERCLTLIEEKEDEVAMLKSSLESAFEKAFSSPDREAQIRLVAASAQMSSGRKSRNSSKEDELTDGLKSSNTDGMVLHYMQEISHKDVEISGLRQKVFGLESAMRELQMNAVAKEEKYVDEIERLQENVSRFRRMSSKDGANMEYLKNVVLSYMLSSDASSRDHMLNAIGAVLIFSKNELKRVKDHNASWWWGQGEQHVKGQKRKT